VGSFGVVFTYMFTNESASSPTILRFLATGEIDTSPPPNDSPLWNTTDASRIFAPALAHSGLEALKFWEIIGRRFSIIYWICLADFGQVSAVNNEYADVSKSDLPGPFSYPATNNIFVNQSLYQNYLEYLQSDQFPFNWAGENQFANLTKTLDEPLQPSDEMFLQSYSCQHLQVKTAISFVIAVISADYPFLIVGHLLVVWIASKLEKRQRDSKKRFAFSRY
jgi:hypothetical protein